MTHKTIPHVLNEIEQPRTRKDERFDLAILAMFTIALVVMIGIGWSML